MHIVGAGDQIVEDIVTSGVGGRGGQHGGCIASKQLDGDAGNAGFSGILEAVVIEVIPHKIAEREVADQAGIDGQVGGGEVDGVRGASGGVGIAVIGGRVPGGG